MQGCVLESNTSVLGKMMFSLNYDISKAVDFNQEIDYLKWAISVIINGVFNPR